MTLSMLILALLGYKILPYYQNPDEASEATTEAVLSLPRKISNTYRMSKDV